MSMLRPVVHFHPENLFGISDIIRCLSADEKILPSKLFYDERGSQLFDRICELPEYYLTRTEQAIMHDSVAEMCDRIGSNALLAELGSGSSIKTRILLDHLECPAGYIPIDISADHLAASAAAIARRYGALEVLPVCADYDQDFQLPATTKAPAKTVVYFPGSTVGNFHPPEVVLFLRRIRKIFGGEAEILIGVDMKKDPGILHRAYNDCDGVTAAFNLNILDHLNQVYGADFDLDAFEHVAFYNETDGRIEMHLKSTRRQYVHIHDTVIEFEPGQQIWTESSYKYTINEFDSLARQAGFRTDKVWTDYHRFFSVHYLVPFS